MQGELESIGNELPGQGTLWVRKYPVRQLNNCIVVDIYIDIWCNFTFTIC